MELAAMHAEVVRYRELLEEHGIEPPGELGRLGLEELRRCRELVTTAYALVTDWRERLGTSKELV